MKITITPWQHGCHDIVVVTTRGITTEQVKGWSNGLFGIRHSYDAWIITHLPSKMAVCGAGTFGQAKERADSLTALEGWDKMYRRNGRWVIPRALTIAVHVLRESWNG